MKKLLITFALLACTNAHADEASKRAKIAKLLVAQGLEQMIQQQLDQSTASVSNMGEKAFNSMVGDAAVTNPEAIKRMRVAHETFLAKAATMFTAKEMLDVWSAHYGKDLTEADIDKILAYYTSTIGQKEIAASKMAMTAFGQIFSVESEKRVMKLLDQFKKDMDAAVKGKK